MTDRRPDYYIINRNVFNNIHAFAVHKPRFGRLPKLTHSMQYPYIDGRSLGRTGADGPTGGSAPASDISGG